jgi:anti-anti-sigma factor
MFMEETRKGATCLLSIDGDIALETIDELTQRVQPYFEDPTVSAVICNLNHVRHIDSAGISWIATFFKALQQKQKRLILSGLQAGHREIISLVGVDRFLSIAADTQSALAFLQPSPICRPDESAPPP